MSCWLTILSTSLILVVDLTQALTVKLLKKSISPRSFDPHIGCIFGACVNTYLLARSLTHILTRSLAQSLTVLV